MKNIKKSMFTRVIAWFLTVAFAISGSGITYAANVLPVPGTLVMESAQFTPVQLKGIKFDPKNPFNLAFILDEGSAKLNDGQLKEESAKLIRYFLAALTTPGKDMWVNLSPYESNRVLPESFSATDLGNDMLAQDYMLKQLAASLTYPESELGKKYWDTLNNYKLQITNSKLPNNQNTNLKSVICNLQSNAANAAFKVWIAPDLTQVYEVGTSVFITKSTLKVLTEADYLAMQNNSGVGARHASPAITGGTCPSPTGNVTDAFKQHILPVIEKEVNTGKNFAQFRQMHSAIILAAWFKNRLKDSIYQQLYIDKQKTQGIEAQDPQAKDKIFNQYVEAFKKGAYNYIRKEFVGARHASPAITGGTCPSPTRITRRQYFSGGAIETPTMDPKNMQPNQPGQPPAPGTFGYVPNATTGDLPKAGVSDGLTVAITKLGKAGSINQTTVSFDQGRLARIKAEVARRAALSQTGEEGFLGSKRQGKFWITKAQARRAIYRQIELANRRIQSRKKRLWFTDEEMAALVGNLLHDDREKMIEIIEAAVRRARLEISTLAVVDNIFIASDNELSPQKVSSHYKHIGTTPAPLESAESIAAWESSSERLNVTDEYIPGEINRATMTIVPDGAQHPLAQGYAWNNGNWENPRVVVRHDLNPAEAGEATYHDLLETRVDGDGLIEGDINEIWEAIEQVYGVSREVVDDDGQIGVGEISPEDKKVKETAFVEQYCRENGANKVKEAKRAYEYLIGEAVKAAKYWIYYGAGAHVPHRYTSIKTTVEWINKSRLVNAQGQPDQNGLTPLHQREIKERRAQLQQEIKDENRAIHLAFAKAILSAEDYKKYEAYEKRFFNAVFGNPGESVSDDSAGPATMPGQGANKSLGGITEAGLTVEIKSDGTRVAIWKNLPVKPEDISGLTATIINVQRHCALAQIVR